MDFATSLRRANLGPTRGGPAIRIACSGKTDVGRRRELNEDTFHCSDRDGLSVVADGMGGREFGEVASSLSVSTLVQTLNRHLPRTLDGRKLADGGALVDVLVQTFDAWIRDVNSLVHGFGVVDQRYREMGTTLALVWHREDYVVVAHVGDSRVYRVAGGRIERLTEDHSFVNAQLKANLITREEAERSQHRHIVTRAIGPRWVVKPDVSVLPARAGDVFLLCTDGLCDLVPEDDMLRVVGAAGADLPGGVAALVDLANERGGHDNVTVILTRLEA
jgi:protein phosphatase